MVFLRTNTSRLLVPHRYLEVVITFVRHIDVTHSPPLTHVMVMGGKPGSSCARLMLVGQSLIGISYTAQGYMDMVFHKPCDLNPSR